MIQIQESRRGLQTVSYKGIFIHSRFDPLKEASRYIDQSIKKNPAVVITIGSSLQYLEKVIQTKNPNCRIISFQLDSFFVTNFNKLDNIVFWDTKESIETFLYKTLKEEDLCSLEVLEWAAGCKINQDLAHKVREAISQIIREYNGSLTASKIMGKKWIHNAITNLKKINFTITPLKTTCPILICASGPSLIKTINQIKRQSKNNTRNYQLWALPSAVLALLQYNIVPDLIITTDSGHYASEHLKFIPENIPIALPLTANMGPIKNNPIVLINQQSFLENSIFNALKLKGFSLLPNGTVAGSAVQMALKLTNNQVYLAGQDFSCQDILSHIEPHAFNPLFQLEISRMNPLNNLLFKRSLKQAPIVLDNRERTSIPLKTYAGWFNHLPEQHKQRLSRLFPSSIPLKNIKTLKEIPDFPHSPNIDKKGIFEFYYNKNLLSLLLKDWLLRINAIKKLDTKDSLYHWFSQKSLEKEICSLVDMETYLEIYRDLITGSTDTCLNKLKQLQLNAVNYINKLFKED